MKRIKKWLPPGLTALAVLAAVLLPPRISQSRDARLLGQIHTEELTVESGLPSRPATLAEKLTLLGMWRRDDMAAAYFSQELLLDAEDPSVGDSAPAASFRAGVKALAEAGILPERILSLDMTLTSGERVLLRGQSSGVSASFLDLWCDILPYGGYLNLVLEEDTGTVCGVHLVWSHDWEPLPAAETGDVFFQLFGIEAQLLGAGKREALFFLPDCALQYLVIYGPDTLTIEPDDYLDSAGVSESHVG